MKKNIILSFALIGLILLFSGNSWAARNGGNPHQKWNKPSNAIDKPDRSRRLAPEIQIQHHRPEGRFIPRFRRPDHHRTPYRFAPKPRPWFHRPFYRPFQPKRHFWQHHRGAGNFAPGNEFSARVPLTDAGFSVSVGVGRTN
jgi:hypothetical protein